MKVVLTRSYHENDLEYISERIDKNILLIDPGKYNEGSLLPYMIDADVLFGSYFTENIILRAENLKFIQVPWTGVDNLDFDLLLKYNITVCNSHSNAVVVAEHAVALMMDAAKKLSYHDRLLRKGKWNRGIIGGTNKISPFSVMISGSKIGILGFGAIGQKIYALLRGFNCTFLAFNKDTINGFADNRDLSVFFPTEIFNEGQDLDFLFVTVPLTLETSQLINKRVLDALKKKTVLINVSRGEVVNEADLYNALKNETISFAAIDTWFNYPTKESPEVFPSVKHKYHLIDNIVLSPHRAGYNAGTFPHLDDAIENLNRCFHGKPLINVISLTKRY